MKKQDQQEITRVCPRCGTAYREYPALSRSDNRTLICPDCGVREALEFIGVLDPHEQDHIISLAKGVKS